LSYAGAPRRLGPLTISRPSSFSSPRAHKKRRGSLGRHDHAPFTAAARRARQVCDTAGLPGRAFSRGAEARRDKPAVAHCNQAR